MYAKDKDGNWYKVEAREVDGVMTLCVAEEAASGPEETPAKLYLETLLRHTHDTCDDNKSSVVNSIQGDSVRFLVRMVGFWGDVFDPDVDDTEVVLTDSSLESPRLWVGDLDCMTFLEDIHEENIWRVVIPSDVTDSLREGTYFLSVAIKWEGSRRETVGTGSLHIKSLGTSIEREHPIPIA